MLASESKFLMTSLPQYSAMTSSTTSTVTTMDAGEKGRKSSSNLRKNSYSIHKWRYKSAKIRKHRKTFPIPNHYHQQQKKTLGTQEIFTDLQPLHLPPIQQGGHDLTSVESKFFCEKRRKSFRRFAKVEKVQLMQLSGQVGKRAVLPQIPSACTSPPPQFQQQQKLPATCENKLKLLQTPETSSSSQLFKLSDSPYSILPDIFSKKLPDSPFNASLNSTDKSIGKLSSVIQMRRKRRWRDHQGITPPIFRLVHPKRLEVLMRLWRGIYRISILSLRLWRAHRIIIDESFNVKKGSQITEDHLNGSSNIQVLFDLRSFRANSDLPLPETTKKILSMLPCERQEKDINMIEVLLRNHRVFAGCSRNVQNEISRFGAYRGFEERRVVVQEGRIALNYYILLTGTAACIRLDENGVTNPVQFLRRGDVFGEEFDKPNWKHGVVTIDHCEFLVLDRKVYFKLFTSKPSSDDSLSNLNWNHFISTLPIFHQWPIELLGRNPAQSYFKFFKRGTLIVEDNFQNDCIYIVKSGSCNVLKKLKIPEKQEEDLLMDEMMKSKSDTRDAIDNYVTQHFNQSCTMRDLDLKKIRESSTETTDRTGSGGAQDPEDDDHIEILRKLNNHEEQLSNNDDDVTASVTSHYRDEVVVIQRLSRGEVFGVNQCLFADQPDRLYLVSNGCECMVLQKKFYLDHASHNCISFVRRQEFPYPSEAELLDKHRDQVTWKAFTNHMLDNHLKEKHFLKTMKKPHLIR